MTMNTGTRQIYVQVAAALKAATQEARTDEEKYGIVLAARQIGRLFEARYTAFDYGRFMEKAAVLNQN
jgi:hypothetical protein